ncbi:hypothetical protein EJB05_49962, partial [Eragrostis curvula]
MESYCPFVFPLSSEKGELLVLGSLHCTGERRRDRREGINDVRDGGAVGGEEGEAEDAADRAIDAAGADAVHQTLGTCSTKWLLRGHLGFVLQGSTPKCLLCSSDDVGLRGVTSKRQRKIMFLYTTWFTNPKSGGLLKSADPSFETCPVIRAVLDYVEKKTQQMLAILFSQPPFAHHAMDCDTAK